MNQSNFIFEFELENYLKEKNKLYKVEITLYDLEKGKKTIFNNYLTLEDERIKCNINLVVSLLYFSKFNKSL